MKKFTLATLCTIAAPVIVLSLFAQEISPRRPLYLHEQKKSVRSTQQHLSTFTSTGDVILDFYADWCGPCNRMSPLIDSLAATMPGFTFIKINRDFFLDLANIFNITSIPTLIFLRNGQEIGRYDGKPLTKHELAQLIIRVYNNK
ncbi:MAG TPA: thioredoxin family protein [Candidatus Babeliales bacterium]|nr:thioredoxin family protein [Candidatus Babeliales bacterium]